MGALKCVLTLLFYPFIMTVTAVALVVGNKLQTIPPSLIFLILHTLPQYSF